VLTIVCREADELYIRTAISNSIYSTLLSFQSLASENVEDDTGRIRVTATLKLHPKDQPKLEQMAGRISMEKSVSSVSWSARRAEPTPE
jgi:putative Mg2+ transporter-C (MgtC) family protein